MHGQLVSLGVLALQAQLSMEGIEATVKTARNRVQSSPEDMAARLDLAWDLFLLAIHRDGTEKAADPFDGLGGGAESEGRDSRELLVESLGHLAIAAELDSSSLAGVEIQRLEGLIRLAGGEEGLRLAREHAAESTRAVVREALGDRQ